MKKSQERKYDAVDGKIVNRASGKPIPDDEPIIIFRAKDRNVVPILNQYAAMCSNQQHKDVIGERINDFIRWQDEHRAQVREPDSDKRCLTD